MVHRLGLDRLFVQAEPGEVQSILTDLARYLDSDLTARRIAAFSAEVATHADDDPLLEAEVQYEGRAVPLVFEYIKDPESADELMVLGPPPVVLQVEERLALWLGSSRLRLVRAT